MCSLRSAFCWVSVPTWLSAEGPGLGPNPKPLRTNWTNQVSHPGITYTAALMAAPAAFTPLCTSLTNTPRAFHRDTKPATKPET